MKKSKRYIQAQQLIEGEKNYSIEEAVDVLKQLPSSKFDETVEISCKLNVDPRKSEQMVRGSVVLPHGTGKKVKIVVFCEPEREKEAKEAGANYVGSQDLVDKVTKENWLDFDYCISTPGMMKIVSKLGRVLGPRGLMPSPKTGTVTENIPFAIEEAKKGKIDFRIDKTGCIHVGVGKLSFSKEALVANVRQFCETLKSSRPPTLKGDFMKTVFICSTMSPSLKLDVRA